MRRWLLLAATVIAGSGCYPIAYQLTPTGTVTATAKPANCDFVIATTKVDKPYDEIGILDVTRNPARSAAEFKAAVQPHVCAAGGDAVFVEVNGQGGYVRGTVLRWREAPGPAVASPAAPAEGTPPDVAPPPGE